MATPEPFTIQSKPGIKKDSTSFEGDYYQDGTWNRFSARALPKKIGGYTGVTSRLLEIIRGMDSFALNSSNILHLGSASLLTQLQVSFAGALGAQVDRTPAGTANAANLWQIVAFYNKVGGLSSVVAHPGQNLVNIANSTETRIYSGAINGTAALTASGMDPVSGGIVPVPPYLMAYGNSGRVDISALNDLTAATANSTFVTAQKVVFGLPLRNSSLPSALLWSLDTLVSAVFDPAATVTAGGDPVFDFNEIATISILSSQCVVELDSIYYWVGVDRFYMFNGVSRELPNDMNIEFFFNNLNFAQRQKVFAYKVPAYGEIWWCYPSGTATECNHAVIYNTRLQTWFDTPLPDGGRSAAVFAKVYQKPFMVDVDLTSTGYTLWQHETGVDKVLGSVTLPIEADYTTHEFTPITAPTGAVDKEYRVAIVEPDFVQSGDLTCTVFGRANARSELIEHPPLTITEVAADAAEQVVRLKKNGRLLSFKFATNTVGGNYETGRVIGHIEQTDGRVTQ